MRSRAFCALKLVNGRKAQSVEDYLQWLYDAVAETMPDVRDTLASDVSLSHLDDAGRALVNEDLAPMSALLSHSAARLDWLRL